MDNNLINTKDTLVTTPEFLPMSPESIEIATTYLSCMDVSETASQLSIPINQVVSYLGKPEIQRYITEVFMNSGYRNRFKLGALLDKIIDDKLMELSEAGITSSKDIIEILAMVQKFRKEEMDHALKMEELRVGKPKRQTNIQVNNNNENGKKTSIFEQLIGDIGELEK